MKNRHARGSYYIYYYLRLNLEVLSSSSFFCWLINYINNNINPLIMARNKSILLTTMTRNKSTSNYYDA